MIGRRLGIVGTCLWAVLIPVYLIREDDGKVATLSSSSDFDPGEKPGFVVESDELVDLLIEDGHYIIRIRDGGPPQTVRSVNPFASVTTRFEATVVVIKTDMAAIHAVGCWNGEAAYVLAVNSWDQVGLIEIRRTSTSDLRLLVAPGPHPALRSAGEPNRLRIDCLGGGTEPTVVVGHVNGEPIASVSLASGIDQFNAFGFWAVAEGPFEIAVDDFRWVSERIEPAMEPVRAGTVQSIASQCEGFVSALTEIIQDLMDGMSEWDSLEQFEAASDEERRMVHGTVIDDLDLAFWQTLFWGCSGSTDHVPGELTASNPVAEEFLARMLEG